MNSLIQNQNGEVYITLKEITDLINVRHDKSMAKVEALAKEPSFGEVSKIDTLNLNNVKVATYKLNKKQAIAVGAKLNNALLMKVIDRIEELETKKNTTTLPSAKELALMVVKAEEEKEKLQIENQKKSQFISNVVHSNNSYTATQIAKDLNISAKLFNKMLIEANVIFKQNGTYILTSRYQNFGLTEIKESQPDKNGNTFINLRWTVKGKNWLKNNWDRVVQRVNKDTFDEYNMSIIKSLPSVPMPHKTNRNF